MASELERAARAVADAVLAHARAVSDDGAGRPAAAGALTQALDEYGAAVVNAGLDAPQGLGEFEAYLGEEDGVEEEPEPSVPGERLALFVRSDFAVEDPDRLKAAALEQIGSCCGGVYAEDDVRTAVDALSHLFGHRPLIGVDGSAGVVPLAETALALRVERTTDGPPSEDVEATGLDPWAPLRELPPDDGQ
jgi:hypothetical protein